MAPALARLLQNGKGPSLFLRPSIRNSTVTSLFPMMRRLFDAVVKPTVSYGSEIWGTLCSGGLSLELKDMQKLQLAFFRQICRLRNSVSAPIVFAELAEPRGCASGGPRSLGSCTGLQICPATAFMPTF